MKKETIKKGISILIICCMAIAMVAIWPLGVIRYTSEVRGYPEEFQYSLELVTNNTVQEYFVPQHDFLQGIVVDFTSFPADTTQGVMHLNLLDQDGNLLAHDYIAMENLIDGYNTFEVNTKVTPGVQYSYYIYTEGMDMTAPKLVYRTLSNSGPAENGLFLMNGIPFEDGSVAGGYDYGLSLRLSQILCYDSFILFAAMVLLTVNSRYFGTGHTAKTEEKRE